MTEKLLFSSHLGVLKPKINETKVSQVNKYQLACL